MFEHYIATGKLLTDVGRGEAAKAVGKNVAKVQDLIDRKGLRWTLDWLLAEDVISANNKKAKAEGFKPVGGMGAGERAPMAAVILGPKIGAFYGNLMGKTGYLTMDLWWTRTINRLRGDVLPRVPGTADRPTKSTGELVGLARFKDLIGKPQISDDDAIALLPEYAARAEEKYKAGIPKTEAEKAAQGLHKLIFKDLAEQPEGVAERKFMMDVARRAQQLLRERGGEPLNR